MNESFALIIAAILSGPIAVGVKSYLENRKTKKMIQRLGGEKDRAGAREDFKVVEAAQRRLISGLYKEMERKERDCEKRIKQVRAEAHKDKLELLQRIVDLEAQLGIGVA